MNLVRLQRSINSIRRDLSVLEGLSRDIMEELYTWIVCGVYWDDPECIHTVDEAIEYINKVGFLPLFRSEIPGFSLEERTVPEYWWCEDPKVSWERIVEHMHENYPIATDKQIRKVLK